MTEKDKQLIARGELLKLLNINRKINNLYSRYEELYSTLYGTGIDYSRERVQTTPTNQLEVIICERICDIEGQLDALINQKKAYIKLIYNIVDDSECNVLIDKYVHDKSFKQIAQELKQPKTNIYRLEKKALTSYYNTNCSIK